MKQTVSRIFRWIAVIGWSLWFGGLMYELFVITPLWSASLPQSAIEWNSRPGYMVIPTPFYAPVAALTIISSLLGALTGWKVSKRRFWMALSTICSVSTLLFTLIYFFPKNEVLFHNQNAGLSGEEIAAVASAWIVANWLRVALMAIGFFSALKVYNADNIAQIDPNLNQL